MPSHPHRPHNPSGRDFVRNQTVTHERQLPPVFYHCLSIVYIHRRPLHKNGNAVCQWEKGFSASINTTQSLVM